MLRFQSHAVALTVNVAMFTGQCAIEKIARIDLNSGFGCIDL